ncbi:AMP-binding-domain-containing protein [Ramaria rubella]|nr:AMP-binding-domain-containing protein [Ramaria rubella]
MVKYLEGFDRVAGLAWLSEAFAITVLTTRELQDRIGLALVNTGVHVVLVDFRELSTAAKPNVGIIGLAQLGRQKEAVGSLNGRVLQFSNYMFDFSVWDWTNTLTTGYWWHIGPHPLLLRSSNTWADAVFIVNIAIFVATDLQRQSWQGVASSYPLHALTSAGTSGSTVYIVDDRQRLVPLGCMGKLFISGPQLARGYLHKPKETARVFVSDPFQPGSLMYATGDLVGMSPEDESITFVDVMTLSISFIYSINNVVKSSLSGSVIFGLHLGVPEAILQTTPAGMMFFPSPTTWKMMWRSVFPSESVKVEAEVVKGHQNMAKAYAGSIEDPTKIWLLMWSIERYNRWIPLYCL